MQQKERKKEKGVKRIIGKSDELFMKKRVQWNSCNNYAILYCEETKIKVNFAVLV